MVLANPITPRQRRLEPLDVLRAVAAVAVIMIHTSAAALLSSPPASRGFQAAGLANQLSRFAVPAFVLITGAGLFYSYGQRDRLPLGRYFLGRLKGLGLPYLFWSIIYFAFYQVADGTYSGLLPRFLVALATANAVYTFYYFPIVVPFYVLFPLVRGLARSRWLDWVTLLVVAGNGFIVWFAFPHPKWALGPVLSEWYPYAGYTPLWWMGPFFLGAWLACRWDVVTAWLSRVWVGLLLWAAGLGIWVVREFWAYVRMGKLAYVATNFRPSAYWYGLVIMLCMLGAAAAWAGRGGWAKDAVLSFGKYSFGVYLVHPLLMAVTGRLIGYLPVGALLGFGINLVLILGGSYLLVRVIALVPGGGAVVGVATPVMK